MSDQISERPLPAAPPPSEFDATRSARRSGAGWIVAAVAFVAIVAGVAWVRMNVPTGTIKPIVAVPDRKPDLQFLVTRALWEQPDPAQPDEIPYTKEFEQLIEGHYDFPFRNPNAYPVTLGFLHTSCDCSGVKATALDATEVAALPTEVAKLPMADLPGRTWTELPKGGNTGLSVPGNGGGIVRMFWNSRKGPGEHLRLSIRVWTAASDRLDEKSEVPLQVPILMTSPIRFDPPKISLGILTSGGVAEGFTYIHSATRDEIALEIDKSQIDELFDVRLEPLDAAGLKQLEKTLRAKKIDTRLRAATKAIVTLREQKGDKQLDQGHFSRRLPVRLKDYPDIETPTVTALTRGDVELGFAEESGKVVFRPFLTREGSVKTVPLWIESPVKLVVEKTEPSYIGAKLNRDKKDSGEGRRKWDLEVTLPPGSLVGTLPEEAVIIIRTDTQPPRRIRIPVIATGGQG